MTQTTPRKNTLHSFVVSEPPLSPSLSKGACLSQDAQTLDGLLYPVVRDIFIKYRQIQQQREESVFYWKRFTNRQ